MALDPAKYFIIVPNMLGNGLSSSPSNTPPPYDKARFPNVTFYDQVQQQHKLVTEKFGIETLPLVTGWSMGAGQTYQWAVSYPDMVSGGVPVLRLVEDERAQHRVPRGRQVRADGRRRVQGRLVRREAGQRPARPARVYAGWGFSQAFYWDQVYKEMGYSSLEDFLVGFWEGFFLDRRDPNNLLTMLWTWQNGDIGKTPGRVRRRPGRGAGVDQGQDDRAARTEGPLLPARGRGVRGQPHPERRAARHPGRVGALRRRRGEPGGHQVHRRRPSPSPLAPVPSGCSSAA